MMRLGRMGLGCMGMSWAYGPSDRAESIATIHRALKLGVTFLDTAEIYGHGENEKLVGEAIAGRRDEVVVPPNSASGGIRTPAGQLVSMARPPMSVPPSTGP